MLAPIIWFTFSILLNIERAFAQTYWSSLQGHSKDAIILYVRLEPAIPLCIITTHQASTSCFTAQTLSLTWSFCSTASKSTVLGMEVHYYFSPSLHFQRDFMSHLFSCFLLFPSCPTSASQSDWRDLKYHSGGGQQIPPISQKGYTCTKLLVCFISS